MNSKIMKTWSMIMSHIILLLFLILPSPLLDLLIKQIYIILILLMVSPNNYPFRIVQSIFPKQVSIIRIRLIK